MRLIDADVLKKEFNNSSYGLAAKSIINNVPTIEHHPCGECKCGAEKKTNGDYIRSLDNNKMAEYIILSPDMEFEVCRYCEYGNTVPDDRGQCLTKNGHCYAESLSEAMKKWLRQPKEESQ